MHIKGFIYTDVTKRVTFYNNSHKNMSWKQADLSIKNPSLPPLREAMQNHAVIEFSIKHPPKIPKELQENPYTPTKDKEKPIMQVHMQCLQTSANVKWKPLSSLPRSFSLGGRGRV